MNIFTSKAFRGKFSIYKSAYGCWCFRWFFGTLTLTK